MQLICFFKHNTLFPGNNKLSLGSSTAEQKLQSRHDISNSL